MLPAISLSKKNTIGIEKENKIFRQEILLLEKDEFYLNLLARKKLGMIKEGEKIYKFDN